jgi:stress-induced morphogen
MSPQVFKGKTTLARHRYGMVNLITVVDDVISFILILTVNEILKDQIAQLHAFSQVTASFAHASR